MDEAFHAPQTPLTDTETQRNQSTLRNIVFVRVGGLAPLVPKRLPNVTLPLPSDGLAYAVEGLGNEEPIAKTISYEFGTVRIDSDSITLFPSVDGEHSIEVPLETRSGKCYVARILLTVNPDPKSLWKDLPVAEGTKFVKPDNVAVYHWIPSDKPIARIVAASQRGRSHANQGTCRDDDMLFAVSEKSGCILLAVADGAGSARFSREGSRLAVEAAISRLQTTLSERSWEDTPEGGTFETNIGNHLALAAKYAYETLQSLAQVESAKDATVALRDFHTTLLLAAVKHDGNDSFRVVTFSIGDGAIAWYDPGFVKLLCSPDSGEFSGQTKFLTMPSIWNEAQKDWETFRHNRCFSLKIPPGGGGCLFLMTDGITDPFFETEASLSNSAVWDSFVKEQLINSGGLQEPSGRKAAEKLLSWLQFWVPGNHDDRTIAVLMPCEGVVPAPEDLAGATPLPSLAKPIVPVPLPSAISPITTAPSTVPIAPAPSMMPAPEAATSAVSAPEAAPPAEPVPAVTTQPTAPSLEATTQSATPDPAAAQQPEPTAMSDAQSPKPLHDDYGTEGANHAD